MADFLIRGSHLQEFLQASMHLTYQRSDPHHCPHGKDHDCKEDGIGETDRRQIRGTIMPDHNRIEQAHQGCPKLGEHHRERHLEIALVIGQYFAKSILHSQKSVQRYKK